ncbi:hypothetical protein [Advenella faeciporci]|nr:hypothetical protein [Advenella faeciporci]
MNPTLKKWLVYGGLLLVLGLVFAMYTQPGLFITLSNQFWSCF